MSSSPASAVPLGISPPAPSGNSTSPRPVPAAATPPTPAATPPPAAQPPVTSPPPRVASPPPSPIPATPPSASAPPPIPAMPHAASAPPPIPATPPSASTPPPSGSPSSPSPPSPPPAATSPPPPPGKSSPPPGTPRSPPSPFKPSNNNVSGSKLSVGVVVGIAVAGVALLAILSLLFIFCKKKKRRHHAPPPAPKAYPYGGPVYNWQQNAPSYGDHVVTIPPKVPPPPGGLPRPPHSPIHPSPPHPRPLPPAPPLAVAPSIAISSEGPGSMYSGSESPRPPPPPITFAFSTNAFQYEELAMATDGFSEANLLGQGGFGYVHRGVLPNGKEVAVKQLKAGSGQGEREFQAEVEVISRVHHKHLVSLVGYCMTGLQRLLVYEFVPNNTLEFHLHSKGRPPLDWSTRLKIALGSAKGLAYLHEECHPKIIHRDIKASNILLDFNFEPKVAGFGLAKLTSDTNTHVSTRVMGTFGYLAPEYASSGKLSDKSDVFSFGVVILELITGRPVDTQHAYMDDSLVDWARPLLTRAIDEENFGALIDPRLENKYNHKEMACMLACAAACVRHSARRRPRLSLVVRALEGDVSLSDLTAYSSHGSSDYETAQYKEDMKKFREMALPSSSEYSGGQITSEYGLNPSGSSSEAQTTRDMETGKMKKDSSVTC